MATTALVGYGMGCQPGCLADTWERAELLAGKPHAKKGMPLSAIDCPDGVAFCEDGVVLAQTRATLRLPCGSGEYSCTCPSVVLGRCSGGCGVDGARVVIDAHLAMRQLCLHEPRGEYRSGQRTEPRDDACEGMRYRCEASQVDGCRPGEETFVCQAGCAAEEIEADSLHAAAIVLCRLP